jgi:hypothetical protein
MQVRAYILLWLWSLLLLEPLSANLSIVSMYSLCLEKQKTCSRNEESKSSCCSKTSCDLPDNKEENDCEGNDCNPLMSCPGGNFYFHNPSSFSIAAFIIAKQKIMLVDDNRISKNLAECWHPPEIV